MTRINIYLLCALVFALLFAAFVFSPAEAAAGVQWCRSCG